MKPIRAPDANYTLHAPQGMENDVDRLHVKMEVIGGIRVCTSTWMLSEEDMQAIMHGAHIQLSVWGSHPPVLLSVTAVGNTGESTEESAQKT